MNEESKKPLCFSQTMNKLQIVQKSTEAQAQKRENQLLGSKELETNVLELQCVMLANHDQNIYSRFRLLQVCFCVKLESSVLQNLLCKSARLDRSKIRLDRSKLVQIVFLQNFPTQAQAHMMCRVLRSGISIKGKTLATFLCCCLCCVYESLVRSRGVCLHTYLGLSRSRLMSRAW